MRAGLRPSCYVFMAPASRENDDLFRGICLALQRVYATQITPLTLSRRTDIAHIVLDYLAGEHEVVNLASWPLDEDCGPATAHVSGFIWSVNWAMRVDPSLADFVHSHLRGLVKRDFRVLQLVNPNSLP